MIEQIQLQFDYKPPASDLVGRALCDEHEVDLVELEVDVYLGELVLEPPACWFFLK
jgi:hypothetical protein